MNRYPWVRGPFLSPDDTGGKGGDGNASGKDGGKSDADSKGSGGDSKQFSQVDIDRVAAKVRGDVESKYSDYGDLKKKVGELSDIADKHKQTKLAEEGKYTEALDTMTKRHTDERTTLQSERDSWRSKYEGIAVDNAILAAADKMEVEDAQDVLALVKATGQVKLGADGVASFADGKSIADGLKVFLSTRPHLVKSKSRAGSGQNHSSGTGSGAALTLDGKSAEEILAMDPKDLMAAVRAKSPGNPFAKAAS